MGPRRDGLRPVQSLLTDYAQRLRHKIRLGAVVLFGSRARGDHWENSDIDLLIISPDFQGLNRSERLDLLLEPWSGIPALEPFGVTPEEALGAGWLLLWDALHQGLALEDDGIFCRAQAQMQQRISQGVLVPTAGGWREQL